MAASDPVTRPGARRERGFALLVVLWTMVLLALLATQLAGAGRAATRVASALREGAQLQAAADAAVQEVMWHMLPGSGDAWTPGAMVRVVNEDAGQVLVTVEDERGKLDVNQASPLLLRALFETVGASQPQAELVANAIADWRTQQPAGLATTSPMMAAYQAQGRAWGPPGTEFQRLDELKLVLGMTPELYRATVPYLTLALEQGPWLDVASPVVLAALARAKREFDYTMEAADPRGPMVFRITARIEGTDGSAFTRRALIRLDGSLGGAGWRYRVLSWESGTS